MELWHGNRESLRTALFSRDSILLWMLRTHARRHREYEVLLRRLEYSHLSVVRIQTSRQAREWLAGLSQSSRGHA